MTLKGAQIGTTLWISGTKEFRAKYPTPFGIIEAEAEKTYIMYRHKQ